MKVFVFLILRLALLSAITVVYGKEVSARCSTNLKKSGTTVRDLSADKNPATDCEFSFSMLLNRFE